MALTLGPAVSQTQHQNRIRVVHAIAMLIGAIMLYGVIAIGERSAMRVDRWVVVGMFGAVVGAAILRDLGLSVPVPYTDLQVAEWLRDLLPTSGVAAAFGWLLGLGFVTKFTYSVHTAFALAVPLLLSPLAAIGVLAVWVAARQIVTFVGGVDDGAGAVCARFAEMRSRLYLLHLTSALVSLLAIGFMIRVQT